MNTRTIVAALTLTAAAAVASAQSNPPQTKPGDRPLRAGDRAPAFELPGSDGNAYSPKQFLNRQALVIVWFPAAFTFG